MKRKICCCLFSLLVFLLARGTGVWGETVISTTTKSFSSTDMPTGSTGWTTGDKIFSYVSYYRDIGGHKYKIKHEFRCQGEGIEFPQQWVSVDGTRASTRPYFAMIVPVCPVPADMNYYIAPGWYGLSSKGPYSGNLDTSRYDMAVRRFSTDENGYKNMGSVITNPDTGKTMPLAANKGGTVTGNLVVTSVSDPNFTPTGPGSVKLTLLPVDTTIKPEDYTWATMTVPMQQKSVYPPTINAPVLSLAVGDYYQGQSYTNGVTATWGRFPDRVFPTNPGWGSITRPDLQPNQQDAYFSGGDTSGMIHYIGKKEIPIRAMDSSHSADPGADTTDTTRTVTSSTAAVPTINAQIPAGAVDAQGEPIGQTQGYSSSGDNPGDGVGGWTNYPVTVAIDGAAIPGDYTLWSEWIPPSGVPADPYLEQHSQTPGAGQTTVTPSVTFGKPAAGSGENAAGWLVRGYCSDNANRWNKLSGKTGQGQVDATMEIKYDPGAPTAGLSFQPETKKFSDISTDGMSGINTAKTSILFRTVGGAVPGMSDPDWQPLSGYSIPMVATNYDVYVMAYDKAGNHDLRLAEPNLKLHGIVQAAIDTDKGAAIHAIGCPNPTSPTKVDGSCLPDCHDAATLELTEGSTFNYIYTLHDTDDYTGAAGTFTSYLPPGVIPTGTALTDIQSTSGDAAVTGTVSTSPELLGDHAGQYKVAGTYELKAAAGGDTLTFEVGCRTPQYDPMPGADNRFANNEGGVTFTMDDGFTGATGYNSAVHKVKPLPMHELTLTKTVTGKYGNRDKAFTFRLDMVQSWGAKLDRTCSYTKINGETGTITIKNGAIEKLNGAPTDSILLKHGQDITIKGLPEGCGYRITEEPREGYTASEKVDGTDYIPKAASAMEGNAVSLNKGGNDSKTGREAGTAALKNAVKRMDGTPTGSISPEKGADITAINLPGGEKTTSVGKQPAGEAATEKEDGGSIGSTVDGVVKGTINTANVQVDYFNDRSDLAVPTGITDIGGGDGMLPALLIGLAALGAGFCLWKKNKSFRGRRM